MLPAKQAESHARSKSIYETFLDWTDRIIIATCCNIFSCTDKKEMKIFLAYKEIQKGEVAKSLMRQGFLIHEEIAYIWTYMRRPIVIYDYATAPF
jgi:hypothetical protein